MAVSPHDPPGGRVLSVAEITHPVFDALHRRKTLFFLPVSALEVHGPHLPLGQDVYMAMQMAQDLAEEFVRRRPDWDACLFPALVAGVDELPAPGSFEIDQRTVRNLVRNYAKVLHRWGFHYCCVTNGHGGPRHGVALDEACEWANRKLGLRMFCATSYLIPRVIEGAYVDPLSDALPEPLTPEEREKLAMDMHGGRFETSFALRYYPDQVDDVWSDLPLVPPPRDPDYDRWADRVLNAMGHVPGLGGVREKLAGVWEELGVMLAWRKRGPEVTYVGEPCAASPAFADAMREATGQDLIQFCEDIVDGRRRPWDYRWPLTNLPIARTDFLRGVAVALAALIVLVFVIF